MDAAEGNAFTSSMETLASFSAKVGGVASVRGTTASVTETVDVVAVLSSGAVPLSATEGGVVVLEARGVAVELSSLLESSSSV